MNSDREYAVALFSLTAEENLTDEYLEHMKTVADILAENEEYIEFLASPAVSLSERCASVDEAFGSDFPEYAVSFLKVLTENGKIRSVFGCIEEFRKLAMSVSARAEATVWSVVELSSEQKNAICAKLSSVTKKQVDATYIIDESLIGGIKIEIEGKTYDGSIRHRLQEVKDVITG